LLSEVFQRDAADEVVQAPSGGDVADDENPLPVPPQWQVGEEPADAGDGLPPAFAARVDLVQVVAPASVQFGQPDAIATADGGAGEPLAAPQP
jgi:hypothetical protein